MWVKLTQKSRGKWVEVQGVQTKFHPGDFVEVGKQTAMKWILDGSAVPAKPGGDLLKCIVQPDEGGAEFSIFCCPMPFEGDVGIWQRNAIRSWKRMVPAPEIVMCYDDEGVEDEAERYGAMHVPNLERNDQGTPLISELWGAGQEYPTRDLVCYVNSDLMVVGLGRALALVSEKFGDKFLLVGQRWDIDLKTDVNYNGSWKKKLHSWVASGGMLHGPDAIDYFAFPKGTFPEVPPFAIGRSSWDNWMILDCMIRGVPVIDATYSVAVVHQEKPITLREENWRLPVARLAEKAVNRSLYLKRKYEGTWKGITNDAPWIIVEGELRERR